MMFICAVVAEEKVPICVLGTGGETEGSCGVLCLASCLNHWHVCFCHFAHNSHVSLLVSQNVQSFLTQGEV